MRPVIQPEELDRREQSDKLKDHQVREKNPPGRGDLFLPFAREEENGDFVAEQKNERLR